MKKKFLFSFITLIIFLLLIELTFRLIFFIKYNKYGTSLAIQGNSLQMGDNTLIFRNRPFYLDRNKKYQFNSEGFKSNARDTKMPVKSAGDFWVFLFGASAMEGMGSNKDGEWLDITGVLDYSYNESIANLLEKQLQLKIPGKKVKVFCAANSGFSIYQSMLQYERLKTKYKMDWVISMDGNNEPLMQNNDSSVRAFIKKDWNSYPIFKSPLKYIIPITKRSAFVNALKQALFEAKMNKRLKKASKNDFPARAKWLSTTSGPLVCNTGSVVAAKTVDTFFYYVSAFDKELTQDGIPHVLYVQPHLTMRDTSKMSNTEKALLNYYKSVNRDKGDFNEFIKEIEERTLEMGETGAIRSLAFMHNNSFETFVDYCHFTSMAINQLSIFFANNIAVQYYSSQSFK